MTTEFELQSQIEELTAERDEARMLVARGVTYALIVGQRMDALCHEDDDDPRVAAASNDFLGLILDNHVPYGGWGEIGPELAEVVR